MWASPYIIAIVLSWVIAQGLKYVIMVVRNRTLKGFRQLYLWVICPVLIVLRWLP